MLNNILTMHESEEILTEVLLAGVRGFLLKSDARSHLIAAVEALLDHRPYFTSVLLEKLLHDYLLNKKDKSEVSLSSREQSVVQLIAEGHTNKSVGAVLNLSVKTIETHRASAMRKHIGVGGRTRSICDTYKIGRTLKAGNFGLEPHHAPTSAVATGTGVEGSMIEPKADPNLELRRRTIAVVSSLPGGGRSPGDGSRSPRRLWC